MGGGTRYPATEFGSYKGRRVGAEKQGKFATVAQAEGVSLSVARRLLQVVGTPRSTPSVPTQGRATREAGRRAGGLLEVLDEAARPEVKQGTADEFLLVANPS